MKRTYIGAVRKMIYRRVFVAIAILGVSACGNKENRNTEVTLFRLLSPEQTGIDFVNQLDYTEQLNTYTYKNFYNGGGVGLGDFNNDGLIDIFFAGNLVPNRLYLNKGDLHFEDVSVSAGILSEGNWTTGVSVVDINGDGLLDIYVCKSGPPGGERRYNELFVNNGNLTFSERSHEYGLAFEGLSTHAAFFDFDRDGDLDCYLLNNSFRSVGGYDLRVGQRNRPDPLGGNKLLRNDDGKFIDITEPAGIFSSEIGFGLGVTIGDVDKDGWPDIYVSNDFFERDYLYMNNRDGTFREALETHMQEISLGSMGADMADINNDGFAEIFVTEMLPENDDRLKTTTQFESWDKYQLSLKNGYFHQFSRNVLQLNNGNGTFSEIGRFAGVEASDWSWGALIFDMDNDGLKDIFVANGIYKELLNQDYVNFSSNPEMVSKVLNRTKGVITQLIDSIPSVPVPNYAFRNTGNLKFVNKAVDWGLGTASHSNGSAYGDLDNDGDLDLVLNNVNMPSFVYENMASQIYPENKSLTIVLHGENGNANATGAKVTIKVQGRQMYQEVSPMRGFMSTVDNRVIMGVGRIDTIDSLVVEWPNDSVTVLSNLPTNQLLHLYQKDATYSKLEGEKKEGRHPVFQIVPGIEGVDFSHTENEFVDFDRDRLLFNMISNEGPCLCTADVNGDGKEDFYIGGAKNQPGGLFLQSEYGAFREANSLTLKNDSASEDTGCIFFDANGDQLPDLYVTSGGYEFSTSSTALLDRLYINEGKGRFKRSPQALPTAALFESTSTVAAGDYDKDGDLDLFVGGRVIPNLYGVPANGYILQNDGNANFEVVSDEIAPMLRGLGLITDGQWIDINNDEELDLILVGEWMPLTVLVNEGGKFVDKSDALGFGGTEGWYQAMAFGDFNQDGLPDLILGNHGLNSRFRASVAEPVSLHINDFDGNGSVEHITTRFDRGVDLPIVLRHDLIAQVPSVKKKFLHFRDYKEKTMEDIFTPEQRENTLTLNANTLETSLWLSNSDGTFKKGELPKEAQFFPVYALLADDFTGDGFPDLLLGGNQHRAKPETGIYAGGYGLLLKGDGNGRFEALSQDESGLSIVGDIRALGKIACGDRSYVLIAKNNSALELYDINYTNNDD